MAKESKAATKKTARKKPVSKSEKVTSKAVKVTKPAAKKAATKKPAAKKATFKKPVAKKAVAKKPATKKAATKKATAAKVAPEAAKEQSQQSTSKETISETVENVFPGLDKDRDWSSFVLRITYIIAFGVLGWIAFGAAITMTGIQVVITVLLGAPNKTLQSWVSAIGRYLAEVFEYVSWNTDEKPFPLGKPVPLDD